MKPGWSWSFTFLLLLFFLQESFSQSLAPSDTLTLVWHDEFEKDGRPDATKWTYEEGFVRNEELQWYQPENAYCANGFLVIEGKKERKQNPDYQPNSADWRKNRAYATYTAASVTTKGLYSWHYGRIVMRAKIKTQDGLWPAFWLLGDNIDTVGWPACGEVDIMEYYRQMLLANVCWEGEHEVIWDDVRKPVADFKDAHWEEQFHEWQMEWDENAIKLYVDGKLLNTVDLSQTINFHDKTNPFQKPFYILLNLAIGGTNGGDPSHTPFPSQYEIDYVRVYQ